MDFIVEYFNRYSIKDGTLIKGVKIDRLRKMLKSLEIRTNHNRLKGLFGSWKLLLWEAKEGKIDFGKLKIENRNKLYYDSKKVEYKNGSIRILGEDNLKIQLGTKSRYACLLANIGKGNKLHNISTILTSYNTTGSIGPNCGIAILQRCTKDEFDKIEIDLYDKDDKRIVENLDKEYLDLLISSSQIRIPQPYFKYF